MPFAGTDEIARRVGPVGVAILHVGRVELPGVDGMTFSMSAQEAADYAVQLDARAVVPVQYDGWKHFSEPRTAAEDSFAHSAIGGRVHWLEPGRKHSFALSSR